MEFVEGLYAEKLLGIAIVATIAIIVVCIVWCVLGGQLQTVFTVMSFVLSLIAGELSADVAVHGSLIVVKLKSPWLRSITRLLYQVEMACVVGLVY